MDEPKLDPLIRDEIYRKGIATSMVKYGAISLRRGLRPDRRERRRAFRRSRKESNEYLKSMRDSLKAMERFLGSAVMGETLPTAGAAVVEAPQRSGPASDQDKADASARARPDKARTRSARAAIRAAWKPTSARPPSARALIRTPRCGLRRRKGSALSLEIAAHRSARSSCISAADSATNSSARPGLNPADPANEKATIDWAMKKVKTTGWGPWHGARGCRRRPREGLGDSTGYVGAPGNRTVTGGGAAAGDSGVMRGVNAASARRGARRRRLSATGLHACGRRLACAPARGRATITAAKRRIGRSSRRTARCCRTAAPIRPGFIGSGRPAQKPGRTSTIRRWNRGLAGAARSKPRAASRTRDLMHLDLGGPRGNLDPASRMSNLPYLKKDEKGDTRKEVPHPEPEISHTTPGYSFVPTGPSLAAPMTCIGAGKNYHSFTGGRSSGTKHGMHPFPGFRHAEIGDRRLEPRFDPAWGTPEQNALHPAQPWFRGDPRQGYGYRRATDAAGRRAWRRHARRRVSQASKANLFPRRPGRTYQRQPIAAASTRRSPTTDKPRRSATISTSTLISKTSLHGSKPRSLAASSTV